MEEEEEQPETRLSLIEKQSDEHMLKINEIKAKFSEELDNLARHLLEIDKMKQDSIEQIEMKKKELQEINSPEEISKEIEITEKYIEERQLSITAMHQTLADLDEQIAKIQAEYDRTVAELELKRRKLNERIKYYDDLNARLNELLQKLQSQTEKYEEETARLLREKSELLKRTDLSEGTLQNLMRALNEQMEDLRRLHDAFLEGTSQQILDIVPDTLLDEDIASDLLTVQQITDLQKFEIDLDKKRYVQMSKEERLHLLRMGLQITPSGRIITKDDKIISLDEARRLGLLAYLMQAQESIEEEEEEIPCPETFVSKGLFYESISSRLSTSEESSAESGLTNQDVEYLKRVFGKSLSLALAEITAVQPSDPIHYLAHWLIKYRYNQEIDEIKRIEIQALMIARERLAAEKWRQELQEEARMAVLEALFRAENIIMQQEFARLALLEAEEEYEGEETDEFDPMKMMF